jgi:hypothetical protein
MIDRQRDLSITRQAKALNISRGSVYYLPRGLPKKRRGDPRPQLRLFPHR